MFGEDRADMLLARDREYNNRLPRPYTRWEDYEADQRARLHADDFGVNPNAKPIHDVVRHMIANGIGSKLMQCADVIWDREVPISEIVNDVCIELGLSDEEFSPSIHVSGFEVEIRL